MRGPGRGPPARRPLLASLLLLLLLPPVPTGAWYKQVASPRYHTVGRAAGLLMGLRRAPYLWRRALRPTAGPLAWDALDRGARPQRPWARDTLSPGPAAREAVRLPSGAQGPWEALRRGSRAEPPGSAPRSARAPQPGPQPDPPLEARAWPSEEQARAFGDSPARRWPAQRPGPARPRLSPGRSRAQPLRARAWPRRRRVVRSPGARRAGRAARQ